MAAWVVPLIIAGVQAATALGTAAAANAGTKNGPRIRGLEDAQAKGRLTAQGQAEADIGIEEEKAALGEDKMRNSAVLGMMGATSGRDIAAQRAADQTATQRQVNAAADRARKAFAGEAQELEDRKAISRQRTLGMINLAVGQAGNIASSLGAYKGATDKGKNEQPIDYKAALKDAPDDASRARLQKAHEAYKAGEITRTEYQAWMQEYRRKATADADTAAVKAVESAIQ